jgi:hypothetical protein
MDSDSRSRRGRDERRDDRRERRSPEKESDSSGGLREMGVDEMNSLRAKLGLKPLRFDNEPPKEKPQPAPEKPKVVQKIEQTGDVEEKIALYVLRFFLVDVFVLECFLFTVLRSCLFLFLPVDFLHSSAGSRRSAR